MKRVLLVVVVAALVCGMALADSGKMTSIPREFSDVLAPQAIDTLEFDVRACDGLGFYSTFVGDSLKMWVDYGYLDRWVVFDSVTFADTAAATQQWYYEQFAHAAAAGTDTTVHFSGFMYPKLRVRIVNMDSTETYSDDADSVTAGIFYMICGD